MRPVIALLLALPLLACNRSEEPPPRAAAVGERGRTVFPPPPPVADVLPEIAVANFLDAYVGLRAAEHGAAPWYPLLGQYPPVLASPLLEMLREDSLARIGGAPATIDFDPFLGAAEPCERYVPAEAFGAGTARLVRVHSFCNAERSADAVLVLELVARDSVWQVFNVHYPTRGTDLLALLDAAPPPR